MRFYFVRHGETDANKQRILQGWSGDYPLNETGILQADHLAERLPQVFFEKVYVSSLRRALETAQILCRRLQAPLEVIEDLREWRLGAWEGQPAELFMSHFLGTEDPPGGETRKEFYARVERAVTGALKGPPFLMVSHGGVWMAIQDLFQLKRSKISNCQLIELTLENGRWHQRVIEP